MALVKPCMSGRRIQHICLAKLEGRTLLWATYHDSPLGCTVDGVVCGDGDSHYGTDVHHRSAGLEHRDCSPSDVVGPSEISVHQLVPIRIRGICQGVCCWVDTSAIEHMI